MSQVCKPVVLGLLIGIAACSAHAQSTVTIGGVVDLGVSKSNGGTSNVVNPGVGPRDVWSVQQGNASRLRFLGQEDLGDGLYARFLLDHRFLPDTGASQMVPFWGGRSVVAVGGKFGEVYLGREYTPAFWVALAGDPTGFNYVSQAGTTYAYTSFSASSTTLDASSIRHSNTVAYKSPQVAGVSGEFAVAAGEGSRKKVFGANLQYASGPMYVGLGVDAVDSDNRLIVATASFDFKFVKPAISFGDAKGGASSAFSAKSVVVSAVVPMGLFRTYAGIARLNPTGNNNNSQKLFAGTEYSLSKRTKLYTNVGSAKREDLTRSTAFDLGVMHTF